MKNFTRLVMFGGRSSGARQGKTPEPYTPSAAGIQSVAPPLPLPAPFAPIRVEWLGGGFYYRQADNTYLHERCYRDYAESDFTAWQDISAVPYPVTDAEQLIRQELAVLGLPLADEFRGLTRSQCEVLAALAAAWHLRSYYAPYSIPRLLRSDLTAWSFSARFANVRHDAVAEYLAKSARK